MEMSDVIARLSRDHGNTRKLLRVTQRQIANFLGGDVLNEPIIRGLLAYLEYYPALYHHTIEDTIYCKLREGGAISIQRIGYLEVSHTNLKNLLADFRLVANQALLGAVIPRRQFKDVADSYVETYRHRIAEEETFFFPSALGIRQSEDWAEISGQFTELADDPLFGTKQQRKFLALHEDILIWEKED